MTETHREARPSDAAAIVDYARSLDCIHCGLCLSTCPTYRLTGAEPSSPRGRIHLMRAVAEGHLEPDAGYAEELDFCLVCRHCESVCPAGVQFGAMMEHARDGLLRHAPRPWYERALRRIGFGKVLVRRRALRRAFSLLRLAQRSGLPRLLAPLLGERGRALRHFPAVPPGAERRALPPSTPARGERAGAVAVLEGCVMPELLPEVNRATATCLAAAGLEVHGAPGHVCCGALHAHNGELEGARALARGTIEAFDALRDETGAPLAVVVNSAGCGAHMKEYGRLLAEDPRWSARAAAFGARVADLSEALAAPARRARLSAALAAAPVPAGEALRVAWDDPCHLCHGQGVRAEPRALLDLLPGDERVELDESESCCGSAGIYSLLRPRDASAVLAPKLDALRASGARVLVTGNPGCQIQWQSGIARAGLDVRVQHLAERIAERLGPG